MRQRPITILVAQGPSPGRDTLQRHLEDAGYRVEPIASGGEAVLQCQLDPPDVLILDFDLPDMDGYEVCEHVRHIPSACDLPIIALTDARDEMSHAYLAQMMDSAGGDFFFAKPYDRNLLLQLVDDVVRQIVRARNRPQPRFPTRVVWPTKNRQMGARTACPA